MMSLLVAAGAIAGIMFSPFPTVAKVLALVPVGFALLMVALEAILVALANLRAATARDGATVDWVRDLKVDAKAEEAAWVADGGVGEKPLASVTPQPDRPRKLSRFPTQRTAGGAS